MTVQAKKSYDRPGLIAMGNRSEFYEIRVEGHLDPRWSEWLEGRAIDHLENGQTLIHGTVVDQVALLGLLARIQNLNLKLVSVQRRETRGTE